MSNDLQLYLLIIQALWAIILLLIGYFVAQLNRTLATIGKKYEEMNERLLKEYATKDELTDRVHGLRDALGTHSTWIHLLAFQTKMNLPGMSEIPEHMKGPKR